MVMYETNWKWPKTEDVCWYTEDNVEIIKAPKLLKNSSTIYSCIEIQKKRLNVPKIRN